MELYYPYDPSSTVRVEESLKIAGGKITLRHIPKEHSITISGFTETDSFNPSPTEFRCDYSLDTNYREANRIIYFNTVNNGRTVTVSYIEVGTVIIADDMNEIKAHMENDSIHGGSTYELPTMTKNIKGGAKLGTGLKVINDTLHLALGTTASTAEGAMWLSV